MEKKEALKKEAEFDQLNKEIKYMLVQKKQRIRSKDFEIEAMETEEFDYWLGEKQKALKALGLELGYNM